LIKEIRTYLKAMRIHRWPRSFSIIVGTVAALYITEAKHNDYLLISLKFLLGFFLTFLICIANYIINEIVDAPFDKYHPMKKSRPVASGIVNIKVLIILAIIYTIAAFTISILYFNFKVLFSLMALLAMGFLYNIPPIRLKDIVYIDAISESANNPIRFLIGWYIIQWEKNPAILYLLCWWAIGSFLMFGKRLSEKRLFKEGTANNYRKSLQLYSEFSLVKSMIISATIFIIAFALIILKRMDFYKLLILVVGIVYIIWILYEAWKGKYLIDEPEEMIKEPAFKILVILLIIIIIFSFYN